MGKNCLVQILQFLVMFTAIMSRKMAYRPFFDPSHPNVTLGFSSKSSPNLPISSKFGESGQKNFAQKIGKNYFGHAYEHKFGQKCKKRGQFGKNMHFWCFGAIFWPHPGVTLKFP